jgi:hypothetical protein
MSLAKRTTGLEPATFGLGRLFGGSAEFGLVGVLALTAALT